MAEADSGSESHSKSFSMRMTIYGISKKFPSVRNVSCDLLEKWRQDSQDKLVILDTRPVEEYQVSHLPGAVRVDPQEECSIDTLGITPDSKIVCYCSVGYRSCVVAQKLFSQHRKKLGASETSVDVQQSTGTNATTETATAEGSMDKTSVSKLDIYNLEGGIFQWACEQREIVNDGGKKVNTVHPYTSFWGKLLPAQLRHKI